MATWLWWALDGINPYVSSKRTRHRAKAVIALQFALTHCLGWRVFCAELVQVLRLSHLSSAHPRQRGPRLHTRGQPMNSHTPASTQRTSRLQSTHSLHRLSLVC